MQKSTWWLSTLILFVVLNFTACGNNYGDAKKTLNKQVEIFETYVEDMDKVKSADDLVKAINTFSEEMNTMIPELKKIAEKYPELGTQSEPPAELQEEYDKISTFSEKISSTMMKNFKYMSDPKVQQAIQAHGKVMAKNIEQN